MTSPPQNTVPQGADTGVVVVRLRRGEYSCDQKCHLKGPRRGTLSGPGSTLRLPESEARALHAAGRTRILDLTGSKGVWSG